MGKQYSEPSNNNTEHPSSESPMFKMFQNIGSADLTAQVENSKSNNLFMYTTSETTV
jgi:hypothetical protein